MHHTPTLPGIVPLWHDASYKARTVGRKLLHCRDLLLCALTMSTLAGNVAAQDPDTGRLTDADLKKAAKSCAMNKAMFPKGEPFRSRSLVLLDGESVDVRLVLVPHVDAAKRTPDGSALKKGKWVGNIYNFGTSPIEERAISGTSDPFHPAVTCVWAIYDPATGVGEMAFVSAADPVYRMPLKKQNQVHQEPAANWGDESTFLQLASTRTDRKRFEQFRKTPIVVQTRKALLATFDQLWYVCDGGGCCKKP